MADALVNITGGTQFLNNSAPYTGKDISAGADHNLYLGNTNIHINSPTLSWARTSCVPGEFLSPETNTCLLCPVNTYSLEPNTSACQQCPEGGAICPGGDVISPTADHWHSSGYSTQIHACLRPEVCLAGGICRDGYTGHVCASCSAGYASHGNFKCAQCMDPVKTIAFYFLSSVGVVAFITAMVLTTMKDNIQGVDAVRPSDFLKILVRHLQYLLIISTVRVEWPASLYAVFQTVSSIFTAANSQIISLDCIFPSEGAPLTIKRMLVYMFAPFGILAAVLGIQCVIWGIKRLIRKQQMSTLGAQLRSALIVSCLVVLFTFYPMFLRVALGFFACIPLDNPHSPKDPYPQFAVANATQGYWVGNMQQACWEGWHRSWALGLGLPTMILSLFGVPLGIWFALWYRRPQVATGQNGYITSLGFLYHNYRKKRYYWEVVSTVQIAIQVAVSVFSFTLGAYYTTLLLQASVILFWAMQLIFKPFAFPEPHLASLFSWGCLSTTVFIALSLFSFDKVLPPSYGVVIGIVGLLVNLAFVLWCMYLVVMHSTGILARCWSLLQSTFANLFFGWQPRPAPKASLMSKAASQCAPSVGKQGSITQSVADGEGLKSRASFRVKCREGVNSDLSASSSGASVV